MKEINVVGAAIRNRDKILAAQRSASMRVPLKWEFPGGKVEAGETHRQALEREVCEETGARILAGNHVATGFSEDGDRLITLDVYEAELIGGTPVAREHARLEWVHISELESLDWAEADIPACRELVRRYGG